MVRNLDNSSINIHQIGAILLAFQIWSPTWHKKKVIIYTNNTTATSSLEDSILQGLTNTLLCQILLLAAKWNNVIKPQ